MPHLLLAEKASGKTYRVDTNEALVGRDPTCRVLVEGDLAKTVSGRHARVFLDERGWFVEDAGSRNGTYVGGRKVEPGTRLALSVGDVIGLGLTGTQLAVQEAVGRAVAATMMEPAPAMPAPASGSSKDHIRIVLRGLQSGQSLVGQGDRITIGRALDCVIRVEGEAATSVSREHAEVVLVNGKVTVRDGGSRHGTFVNGNKINAVTPIAVGDELMLGPGGPVFSVDELGMVSAAAVITSMTPAQPADESYVGPTGVREAFSRKGNQAAAVSAMQPTPSADLPAFRKSALSDGSAPAAGEPAKPRARSQAVAHTGLLRNVLGEMSPKNAQLFRTMVWGAVGLFTIATAGILFVGRPDSKPADAPDDNDVRQQAAQLEATRSAAVADASRLHASLDSATDAAAPAAIVDSLRKAVTEADQRSSLLTDSLKHVRAAANKK